MKETKWSENIILVDADYVDKVAFDLIVNFERMLGRRIPQADMARWLECVALDGGLRPQSPSPHDTHITHDTHDTHSTHSTPQLQVILLHKQPAMSNFHPSAFADLDGKAFAGPLGEFLISCVPVEDMVTMDDLFTDSLQIISNAAEVRRLIIIPNCEHIYNNVRATLRKADPDKHYTLLTMQPLEGGAFRQEILGYSLMAALGISADELKE